MFAYKIFQVWGGKKKGWNQNFSKILGGGTKALHTIEIYNQYFLRTCHFKQMLGGTYLDSNTKIDKSLC